MDYTAEQITEKYNSLPKDVRSAIESAEVSKKVSALAQKYKLHIDMADELSDEVGLVMLGLTHPQDFMGNLKRRLEIPEDMARDLVADINEQIFSPIKESLKKIHGLKNEGGLDTDNKKLVDEYSKATPASVEVPPAPVEPAIPEENTPMMPPADRRVLAESGIELQEPATNDPQSTNNNGEIPPKRSELLDALENPADIQKETVSMPGGFSMTRTSSAPAKNIVSPDEKLDSPIKTPPTTTTYEENPPAKTATEQKKPSVDPYREPIV